MKKTVKCSGSDSDGGCGCFLLIIVIAIVIGMCSRISSVEDKVEELEKTEQTK
jgi:hypothetical protein